MISLSDYLMGRHMTHPEEFVANHIAPNANRMLAKVNGLLAELRIEVVKVSSGWRPRALNEKVKKAATNSYHIVGRAVDLVDSGRELAGKISARPELLAKYRLWMEDPSFTPTWVHLDDAERPDRPVRIFRPY